MGVGVNSCAFQVPVKSAGDAKKVKGKPKKKKDKIQAVKVKHGFGASKR